MAAAVLALTDEALSARLEEWRARQNRRRGRAPARRVRLMAGLAPLRFGPGTRLGILGGGQLGRMIALAAADYGIACHIFAPEADSPAFEVAASQTCADYRDEAALTRFAREVDVITSSSRMCRWRASPFWSGSGPCAPARRRWRWRRTGWRKNLSPRAQGLMTADFAAIASRADLEAALARIGCPAVLKTTRMAMTERARRRS